MNVTIYKDLDHLKNANEQQNEEFFFVEMIGSARECLLEEVPPSANNNNNNNNNNNFDSDDDDDDEGKKKKPRMANALINGARIVEINDLIVSYSGKKKTSSFQETFYSSSEDYAKFAETKMKHIVLYINGTEAIEEESMDMTFSLFFVAHMLRKEGHKGKISVLLLARDTSSFEAQPNETINEDYEKKDKKQEQMVKDYESKLITVYDLLQNLTTQRLQVIDTRAEEYFHGDNVESGGETDDNRAGHIPSALNIPHFKLKPDDNDFNAEVFKNCGVDVNAPIAVIGGGGKTNCSSAPFVIAMLEKLGAEEVFYAEGGMYAWKTEDNCSYPLYYDSSLEIKSRGRLIVWSVTRGRSTALERSFTQHSEIMVMHELLTEPYLKENKKDNYEKIKNGQMTLDLASSGCSYQSVLELMRTDYSGQEKLYFFSKELSCYFDEGKCSDDWLHSFHHVILVRDPSDALKSFYRVGLSGAKETVDSLYFDASESGFKECKKIIEKIESIQAKYMVIDADLDLMKNPEQTLKQICAFASIPFHKNMLSWNPQELESWKKFRGWHDDAVNSSSFKAPDRTESNAEEYPKEIYEAIADSMEYYRFCIYKRKDDARSLID